MTTLLVCIIDYDDIVILSKCTHCNAYNVCFTISLTQNHHKLRYIFCNMHCGQSMYISVISCVTLVSLLYIYYIVLYSIYRVVEIYVY